MSPSSFDRLAAELAAVGARPAVISRLLQELEDHCDDAEAAARAAGLDAGRARREALRNLGEIDAIVQAVGARRELLDWRHRWPRGAHCIGSLGACMAWPIAPFVYCTTHPQGIVRWGVSSGLGAGITASILLLLNSLIS